MADYIPAREIRTKIHELIGNPDAMRKNKPDRHKYYKKPGRGHNRDNCDACGDTGDIVCCDGCPASFHLNCLNPPLDEDGLPDGSWQCRACSSKKRDRQTGQVKFTLSDEAEVSKLDVDSQAMVRLFGMMVWRAKRQNPVQYKPPSNVATYEQFLPGASRRTGKKFKLKVDAGIVEVDPKTGKIRAVLCYNCDIGSRIGAMIKCDFCPNYFHLDCVEPPLTTVPAALWICPLHANPVMESKYLESSGVMERLRIWDLSNEAVVPSEVTLNFVRKTHCPGPIKTIKLAKKPRVETPSFITEIYNEFLAPLPDKEIRTIPLKTEELPSSSNLAQITQISEQKKTDTSPGLNLLLQAVEVKFQEDVLDNCLKNVHPEMVKLLAAQKLLENPKMTSAFKGSPQVPSISMPMSTHQEEESSPSEPLTETKRKQSSFWSDSATKRTRLMPTLSFVYLNEGKIVEFQRRSLDVGTGGGVTLDLSKLGSCSAVSKRHATIYYDQITGRWELLNYSDSGTIVNGVLYGIDTSHYDAKPKAQDDATRHFKQLVDQRKQTVITKKSPNENLFAILAKEGSCFCSSEESVRPRECWEGSAVIRKGDTIQFGCHKFVVVNTGHVEGVASIDPMA